MNAPTLAAEARRNVVLFLNGSIDGYKGKSHFEQATVDGSTVQVLKKTDVPVFRSGTFRDSMGIQHNWEPLHMEQMVAHFNVLKSRLIFDKVPVRDGHPSFFGEGGDVVGWHDDLRTAEMTSPVDQQTYTYLIADYTLLDPEAIAKDQSGLFVNLSAEIGSYVTNNETEFWPVYQGVAYVDIPAVEGLRHFSKNRGLGTLYSIMDETTKEAPVGDKTSNETTPPAAPPQTPASPAGAGGTVQQPQAAGGATQSAHGAAQAPAFQFTIGGRTTSDFAAVQAHIVTLETALTESKNHSREQFVDQLAKDNKIVASKVDSLKSFAKELTDSQFTAWCESWDSAPAVQVLQQHGHGGEGTTVAQATGTNPREQEIADLKGVVAHHKASGMTDAALQQTGSYKRLQQLLAQSGATSA